MWCTHVPFSYIINVFNLTIMAYYNVEKIVCNLVGYSVTWPFLTAWICTLNLSCQIWLSRAIFWVEHRQLLCELYMYAPLINTVGHSIEGPRLWISWFSENTKFYRQNFVYYDFNWLIWQSCCEICFHNFQYTKIYCPWKECPKVLYSEPRGTSFTLWNVVNQLWILKTYLFLWDLIFSIWIFSGIFEFCGDVI